MSSPPPADVAALCGGHGQAVHELATRVRAGLVDGPDAGMLATFVAERADRGAALAAVRVLGADAVAAHVVTGMPLSADELAVVREAADLFPVYPDGTEDDNVLAWQRWALLRLALAGDATTAPGAMPARSPLTDPAGGWKAWSSRLPALASLAVAQLDGPVHAAVRARPVALARAASRAMMRRDYPTAAAFGRWLALLHAEGVSLPLRTRLFVSHTRLMGGADARAALDACLAEYLLRRAEP